MKADVIKGNGFRLILLSELIQWCHVIYTTSVLKAVRILGFALSLEIRFEKIFCLNFDNHLNSSHSAGRNAAL